MSNPSPSQGLGASQLKLVIIHPFSFVFLGLHREGKCVLHSTKCLRHASHEFRINQAFYLTTEASVTQKVADKQLEFDLTV